MVPNWIGLIFLGCYFKPLSLIIQNITLIKNKFLLLNTHNGISIFQPNENLFERGMEDIKTFRKSYYAFMGFRYFRPLFFELFFC